MKQYQQALNRLNSQGEFFKDKWELENVIAAFGEIGIDRLLFPSVQIVGTNGKGTTACFLARILREHNYKVGLFSSPHLIDLRERICINGQMISQEDFATWYFKLLGIFDKYKLSYFEKITLLATCYFKEQSVDYGVFETGLGGRLDAVTALKHPFLAITSIALDHMEYLGDTIEQIVVEKIFPEKFCKKAFSAVQTPQVQSLLAQASNKIQWVQPTKVDICKEGTSFTYKNKFQIPMWGEHYAQNASLALEVSKELLSKDFSREIAKKALKNCFWPGRLQLVSYKEKQIMLSCAHNLASFEQDIKTVLELAKQDIISANIHILMVVSRNRDPLPLMAFLQQHFSDITLTQLPNIPISGIEFPEGIDFIENWEQAFGSLLPVQKTLLVIGSIYLSGMILEYIQKSE